MTIQQLDDSILLGLNSITGHWWLIDKIVEFIGIYTIYYVPIALVVLWFNGIREVGIRAALAGAVTWLIASPLIAQLWFRPRPILGDLGGLELFFHRPTYSFPSDHAGFLAAVTLMFYLAGLTKLARVFLAVTILVSLGRIALGFHYPTDIVGGALLGLAVAWAVHYYQKQVDQYFSTPIIELAKRLKLA